MNYIIISIIIGIISIGIAFYIRYSKETQVISKSISFLYKSKRQKLEEELQKEFNKLKELYIETKDKKEKELEDLKEFYNAEKKGYENDFMRTTIAFNQKMSEIKEKRMIVENEIKILEERKGFIQESLNEYYDLEKKRIDEKLTFVTDKAVSEISDNINNLVKEKQEELNEIQQILEKHQAMRAAVNEDIMRERQLQEQSEFFTINLSEQEIADLLLIKELAPRFNNRELLNKIIYESYVKRPLQEMIKRVLGGKSPSGIYKITRKSTGEIYIGRAVSVDKRWVEHVKMAFSIGSIAHSTLHTIMEKDGIWNFTFELLEEVPKDQLNEREKYYIDFYDSKNFGMNQKNGG